MPSVIICAANRIPISRQSVSSSPSLLGPNSSPPPPAVPKPPRNLTHRTVNTNLVLLNWLPPEGSDYSEYAVRYRTAASTWQRLVNVHEPQARIEDMHYGERYLVQVNTVSFGVESPSPLELNISMPPQPVSNVVPLVDSRNLTLEWPRPDGHVDYYTIKWWATDEPQQVEYKNVSQQPEEGECRRGLPPYLTTDPSLPFQ